MQNRISKTMLTMLTLLILKLAPHRQLCGARGDSEKAEEWEVRGRYWLWTKGKHFVYPTSQWCWATNETLIVLQVQQGKTQTIFWGVFLVILKHSCPNVFIAHVLPIWRTPFSRTGFLSVVSFHALNWLMISLSILINTQNSSFLCMFYTFFLSFLCKSTISCLKSQIIKVENDRKWFLKG